MPRSVMARVYIGDVGTVVPPTPKVGLPPDIDFSQMTFRELCNLAVVCGIPVRDLIGIDHCYDHQDMIAIGGRELPEGYNLFETCVYCRNCFLFYRIKNLSEKVQ